MRAQLESHLLDVNRTADMAYDTNKPNEAIDLVVVTDSEAILGIGGESNSPLNTIYPNRLCAFELY
jgi:malate dehydrogenase (oxaloacetate-decarboxylating)